MVDVGRDLQTLDCTTEELFAASLDPTRPPIGDSELVVIQLAHMRLANIIENARQERRRAA